jgi:adenylate cyclase
MVRYLIGKTKQFIVSLRLSLISIFTMLFIVTMLTLVSIFYFHLTGIVEHAALLLMDRTSYSILHELDLHLLPIKSASQLTANNLREKIIDVNNQRKISDYLAHLLLTLPLAQGGHWGDVKGNFIYAYKDLNGNIITEFINRGVAPPTQVLVYQDKNHKILKRVSVPVDYDPRTHLWFQTAISKKRTIWTDVTVSEHKPTFLGITVATPAFDNKGEAIGVFGIDIRLDALSRDLANQNIGKNGQVFILDHTGKVIISPEIAELEASAITSDILTDVHNTSNPWQGMAYDIYKLTSQTLFTFKRAGVTYFASFEPISIFSDNDWLIGIVAPAEDFTKKIHHVELNYILIIVAIFMIGVALISNLVTRVVKPIKKLVKETAKIKNFELESSSKISSSIKEVVELSDAIYGMKMGLRSFQKYVPAGLVRQLIKTGEAVRIGGTKRELAIFFSDINDFSLITEVAESNELAKQMGVYFEALSRSIIEHHGTIDKYIGDSLMAFWGAPVPVFEPCHQAALAALRSMKRVNELNAIWSEERKPEFFTRIGIHFGEVIVGNFGSSERLNYTLIGDSVNIASRLEGVNKLYGTSIIVSESVYQQIKDTFVLRKVDEVILKGKAASTVIYELLGETKQRILFDVDAYRHAFSIAFSAYQARQWDAAKKHFDECLRIYLQDTLAPVFIARCEWFLLHPPVPEWNGVWQISEK